MSQNQEKQGRDYFGCILVAEFDTAQKMKFSLRISSVNVTKSTTADLVTFTEEILNVKLHFLCSGRRLRVKKSRNYKK